MYDYLQTLASAATGTVTMTHGTVDLLTKSPLTNQLYVRWRASAGSASSGTAKTYPVIDHSSDQNTWHFLTDGTVDALSLTSTGSLAKVAFVPVNTNLRYIRLRTVIVGGTAPTVTVSADLGIGNK